MNNCKMRMMRSMQVLKRTLALACGLTAAVCGLTAPAGGLYAQDAGVAAEPAPEVTMIRLRGGRIQWGSIVDHTAEALIFTRLDTGGQVTLPWNFLDPAQDLELRMRFGYVDLGGDEVMMSAELIVLVDGQEVIGRVQGRTQDAVLFKSGGLTLAIPKQRIRSHVAGVRVPALDIYTRGELYADEFLRSDGESAESQRLLAEYCERIFDFPHALQHYLASQELDSDGDPKALAVKIARVQAKVDSQEQVDYLAHVDHLSRRKNYAQALLDLEAFDGLFPDSPLLADRIKLEKRVIRVREAYTRKKVATRWFAWMGRLAAKAAREKTYQESLTYVGELFGEEIVLNVTLEMRRIWPSIEEDQVRQFFIERKRGRWKPASYGLGTWLLGEDDALKGGTAEVQKKEPESARDRERADLEEKINRFMRNQQMQKRNSNSEEDEEEVANFWKTLSSSARRYWLIAYYAENAGHLDVRSKPELRNCSECAGTGAHQVIYTGSARAGASSGLRLVTCGACHGIGRVRRIRYR